MIRDSVTNSVHCCKVGDRDQGSAILMLFSNQNWSLHFSFWLNVWSCTQYLISKTICSKNSSRVGILTGMLEERENQMVLNSSRILLPSALLTKFRSDLCPLFHSADFFSCFFLGWNFVCGANDSRILEEYNSQKQLASSKGQLISNRYFGVFKSTKKPKKKGFLP